MLSIYLTLAVYTAGIDFFNHLCDTAQVLDDNEMPIKSRRPKEVTELPEMV